MISVIILAMLIVIRHCSGNCPNNCNSNGICDIYSRCECTDDYMGADCSLRSCPKGIAWSDQATGVDIAHSLSVCSSRGICDTTTGHCRCMQGFTGHACERLECLNNCNGNGKCVTVKDYASHYR